MVNKIRVFWVLLTVCAILLSTGCGKKKTTDSQPSAKTWTILGYFDDNNPQDTLKTDTCSHVIADVQEMEQVGSTEDVRTVVMLGSTKTYGNCNYYLIEKHLNEPCDSISSKVLDSLGRKDMSDPQTLSEFIRYGVDHYPADRYMLIINDHGSGWKGVCSDQVNGDSAMMSLPEFYSALSGYTFDIILFNAPSMSMVEVAYELKDRADYMVASQFDPVMKNILGSATWLQELTDNPNMGVSSLAQSIATAIHTAAVTKGVSVSISAADLSKVDALTSSVADLGSLLVAQTGGSWGEVVDARQTSSHSQLRYFDADIKRFSQNIQSSTNLSSVIRDAAGAVQDAIGDAVIRTLTTEPGLDYGGLCIHFPLEAAYFDSAQYVEVAFEVSNWHKFLSSFTKAYAQINSGSLRGSPHTR